jgi:hypothetical protein
MIQGGSRLGFLHEPPHALGIGRDVAGENFQRGLAIEPGVLRQIHLAHAPGAEDREDLKAAETSAGRKRQRGDYTGGQAQRRSESVFYAAHAGRSALNRRPSSMKTDGGWGPQIRADGREVFFATPDGLLKSSALTPVGDGLTLGAPTTLFKLPAGASGQAERSVR